MDCPRCSEPVESGAAFCGNCGQRLPQLAAGQASDIGKLAVNSATRAAADEPARLNVPNYALADPQQHKAETKAMVGLVMAVLAIPGAVMPVVGSLLAMGALALVLPLRRILHRKTMAHVSIAAAGLGVVLSIGTFTYNLNQYNRQQAAAQAVDNPVALTDSTPVRTDGNKVLDTLCYRVVAPSVSNADIAGDTCTGTAYEAETVAASRNVYKIQAIKEEGLTAANLSSAGKEIASKNVISSLPNFTVTNQREGRFADSPAYYIDAKSNQDVTMQMAIVVRKVTHGENVFIIMHAINGQADLSAIAKGWSWK